MEINQSQIKLLADRFMPEIIEIRRYLHENPEISFKEYNTARYVAQRLAEWGLKTTVVAETGLICEIAGARPGKEIVLRADLDALPIQEETALSYRSKVPGVMHACGHDVHTASVLGACRIISELRDHLHGNIRFLFQPAEELLPGGASRVLEEGVLENPPPDLMIAQHVFPELPAGKVGFREGQYMASTDEIYIVVKGTGGHAGMPHTLVDPVLIASHLVVNLQQIVSRKAPPEIPTVLSFGKFNAPGATNVIPQKVWLEGTFRTQDEKWRSKAHQEIISSTHGIVEAMGGRAEIDIVSGYPSLFNNVTATQTITNLAAEYLGKEQLVELPIRMTGEDFARYSQKYKTVFYRLGTGYADRENYPVHHPKFEVNETAIKTGMGLLAFVAMQIAAGK